MDSKRNKTGTDRTDKTGIVKGFIFILILLSLFSGIVYAKSDLATGSYRSSADIENIDGKAGGTGDGETDNWIDRVDEWTDYRTEKSIYYPCSRCHDRMETNTTVRTLKDAHITVDLKHGGGILWCLQCHNPDDRDTFILYNGKSVGWDNPSRLCGKCHGQIYRDWKDGIHGKRTGSWEDEGGKNVFQCIKCHNPHDPTFKPIEPEAPPDEPAKSPTVGELPILVFLGIVTFLGLVLFAVRR